MNTLEKLNIINGTINKLNDSMLKYKSWKLKFINRGANNYCLTIYLKGKELFNGKYDTYGSVISALNLLDFMFSKALDELDKEERKK